MGTENRNGLLLADNHQFPLINQTVLLTETSEMSY